MNIDISNNGILNSYLNQTTSRQSTTSEKSEQNSTLNAAQDTVTISAEAKALYNSGSGTTPPKPPEEVDFDSMSDEELVSYLKEMQQMTGNVPGMSADTNIDELTDEQLGTIRETLGEMSANPQGKGPGGPGGAGRPAGGPPPSGAEETEETEDDTEMTYQELLEYLEELQEKRGGNIAGLSEDTDLSTLSIDELNQIRNSITGTAGA